MLVKFSVVDEKSDPRIEFVVGFRTYTFFTGKCIRIYDAPDIMGQPDYIATDLSHIDYCDEDLRR